MLVLDDGIEVAHDLSLTVEVRRAIVVRCVEKFGIRFVPLLKDVSLDHHEAGSTLKHLNR